MVDQKLIAVVAVIAVVGQKTAEIEAVQKSMIVVDSVADQRQDCCFVQRPESQNQKWRARSQEWTRH